MRTDPPSAPLLVDIPEAARLLGVCANTVRNLIRAGDLASVKLGARRLVRVADLERLVAKRAERKGAET